MPTVTTQELSRHFARLASALSHLPHLPQRLMLIALASGFCSASAMAAKLSPSPDFNSSSPVEVTQPIDENRRGDTVDIAQPEKRLTPIRPVGMAEDYYPYRRALTVRAGPMITTRTDRGTNNPALAGAQLMFTTESRRIYEATADLRSNSMGDVGLGRRWVVTETRMRPYLQAGLNLLLDPQDNLAAFVKFANLRLNGGCGMEYLIERSNSVRISLESNIGTLGTEAVATAGYVFAW